MTTVLRDAQAFRPGNFLTGLTSFSSTAPVNTTDGTTTQVAELKVNEGEVVGYFGIIVGSKDDESAGFVARFEGCARRAAAGNVTAVGTPLLTIYETSAGTNATITADTTNQTVDFNVVGIAAENWRWELHGFFAKV